MAYRRILIALMLAVSGSATAAGETVPEGYIRVAVAHGVPPEALYSVSLTETEPPLNTRDGGNLRNLYQVTSHLRWGRHHPEVRLLECRWILTTTSPLSGWVTV